MKNAIILNGTVFQVKKMSYIGLGQGPCDKCDLKRKCEGKNYNLCDVFNSGRGNSLAYFKSPIHKISKSQSNGNIVCHSGVASQEF